MSLSIIKEGGGRDKKKKVKDKVKLWSQKKLHIV